MMMSFIVENLDTRQMILKGKLVEEKKIVKYMNYIKQTIFEFIKEDITSLNINNVYLIDRVYYPYKSPNSIMDNIVDCNILTNVTLTSKNAFLSTFIDSLNL